MFSLCFFRRRLDVGIERRHRHPCSMLLRDVLMLELFNRSPAASKDGPFLVLAGGCSLLVCGDFQRAASESSRVLCNRHERKNKTRFE
mmetsp:Transcript_39223/g.58954  ORF Transcript_39223/g.58954 Transcript_39223/m.58954 type:complete len:88 (-) Transcript_39223:201-464(-)